MGLKDLFINHYHFSIKNLKILVWFQHIALVPLTYQIGDKGFSAFIPISQQDFC